MNIVYNSFYKIIKSVCAKFNITIREKVKIFNLLSEQYYRGNNFINTYLLIHILYIYINTYVKNFEQFKKTEFKRNIYLTYYNK